MNNNIDISLCHVKRFNLPSHLKVNAWDYDGTYPQVEVYITPQWRRKCGIDTYSQLVEQLSEYGMSFTPAEEVSNITIPGFFSKAFSTADMEGFHSPEFATFFDEKGSFLFLGFTRGTA